MSITDFIRWNLFEACAYMSVKDTNEHWEAYRQLGGLVPRTDLTYKRKRVWTRGYATGRTNLGFADRGK